MSGWKADERIHEGMRLVAEALKKDAENKPQVISFYVKFNTEES